MSTKWLAGPVIPLVNRPASGIVQFVQDIDKTLEYYTETLGFTEVERWTDPDDNTVVARTTYGTSGFSLDLASIPRMVEGAGSDYDFGEFGENLNTGVLGNGVVTFFRVPNVDKYYQKINANGAIIDEPPTDQAWGQRTISVLTPDNHYLTFWQPIKGFKPDPSSGMVEVKPGKGKGRKAGSKKKR
jgi:catechol 2,3-dioxygenase-like lactoylglutathione lyase family enzyme